MTKSRIDELASDFLEHYVYEYALYQQVAGSSTFEILSLPYDNGTIPPEADIKEFIERCNNTNIVPIIKYNYGNISVVSSPNTTTTGIISEVSLQGFEC